MSTCISKHGEFSAHEPGDWCPRCAAFNEEAIVAERDALRLKLAEATTVRSVGDLTARHIGKTVVIDGDRFENISEITHSLEDYTLGGKYPGYNEAADETYIIGSNDEMGRPSWMPCEVLP